MDILDSALENIRQGFINRGYDDPPPTKEEIQQMIRSSKIAKQTDEDALKYLAHPNELLFAAREMYYRELRNGGVGINEAFEMVKIDMWDEETLLQFLKWVDDE